jgi:hypothetical protein
VTLTLDAWNRLLALNPQQEGELPSRWMERLEAIAAKRSAPEVKPSLPYRDAPDPPDPEAWKDETCDEIFGPERTVGEDDA